jgi:hypothetical protein
MSRNAFLLSRSIDPFLSGLRESGGQCPQSVTWLEGVKELSAVGNLIALHLPSRTVHVPMEFRSQSRLGGNELAIDIPDRLEDLAPLEPQATLVVKHCTFCDELLTNLQQIGWQSPNVTLRVEPQVPQLPAGGQQVLPSCGLARQGQKERGSHAGVGWWLAAIVSPKDAVRNAIVLRSTDAMDE